MKTLVSCTLAAVLAFGVFAASASADGYGSYGQSYGKKGNKQTNTQIFRQGNSQFQVLPKKGKKWNGPSQWNGSSQWNGGSQWNNGGMQYYGGHGY